MFEYFRENYTWNLALNSAIFSGGAIGEVEEACRPLQEASVRNDAFAQQAWYESWKKVAERVERMATDHEHAGQLLSAGRKDIRASIYYLAAERMLGHKDPRKVQTYRQALSAFKKGLQFRAEPVEWVEVPFRGTSLPALFSKAPVPGRAPCMVHFDGFDMMKEVLYLRNADEFRRRGISVLYVDHPGVGEALRLRHMPATPDVEVPAAAAVDYLETRADIDAERIGIVAHSLGGYYAPRAAAFEKRFKCCVAWGAIWEFGDLISRHFEGRQGEPSVPAIGEHAMWVFGKDKLEDAIAVAKQMTLEGVADKITCPLLVFHGENDRQVPLWRAEKTIDAAVKSPSRMLKVFTLAEGGAEHCQADNYAMAVDYMTDWVAETLGGTTKGV